MYIIIVQLKYSMYLEYHLSGSRRNSRLKYHQWSLVVWCKCSALFNISSTFYVVQIYCSSSILSIQLYELNETDQRTILVLEKNIKKIDLYMNNSLVGNLDTVSEINTRTLITTPCFPVCWITYFDLDLQMTSYINNVFT